MENETQGMRATISMLGGFSIQVGDVVLTDESNRSQKLWNVLAYLLIHRDRSVPQAEFVEQFWPSDSSTNPSSALKTLLHRVRAMLEPLFGPELDPIVSQRGAYAWNPDIECDVDIDRFSVLCQRAESASLTDEERMELYRRATQLYRGDFLPKLSGQLWTLSVAARYHERYLQAVKGFAALLEKYHAYEEMTELCTRATQLEVLDEELHILAIRAMVRQGKDTAALRHYRKVVDHLCRSLGEAPSEDLRALYNEIMAAEHALETDLEVIQGDLREAAARPGAFLCEYEQFKEAYRLEARRTARSGECAHVVLITVAVADGGVLPAKLLTCAMDQLQAAMVKNLRRGDVVARYSSCQYVVLLHAADFENSTLVMERVTSAFFQQNRRTTLKLPYKIRSLD